MDEIDLGLHVGTVDDASDSSLLKEQGITAVLSLTHEKPDIGDSSEIRSIPVPMMDGPQNDRNQFGSAVNKALDLLNKGERVLIHCSAGASRSPAVAATVLAIHKDKELDAAFQQVSECREPVDPHEAMINQAVNVYTQRKS